MFRGNTYCEIEATIQSFPRHFTVIAPAFPAVGRTTSDGFVHVHDVSCEHSIPVRQQLHENGLNPEWITAGQHPEVIRQAMLQSLQDGCSTVFCDALQDEDLASVVQAAKSLNRPILWIGSAGLAHALASQIPTCALPKTLPAKGSVLLFVGSTHPINQKQVKALREQFKVADWPSTNDAPPTSSIFFLNILNGVTTPEDVQTAVAEIDPAGVGCLFMTGGDTAHMVCQALGVESIHLQQEFAPGVSQGTAIGEAFSGCSIILKSGGFGDANLLHCIAQTFNLQKRNGQ